MEKPLLYIIKQKKSSPTVSLQFTVGNIIFAAWLTTNQTPTGGPMHSIPGWSAAGLQGDGGGQALRHVPAPAPGPACGHVGSGHGHGAVPRIYPGVHKHARHLL